MEDVKDAIGDLLDVIKTYRSKNKIAQVLMSSLFRQRQDEAEAVIDRAIARLHVSATHRRILPEELHTSRGPCGIASFPMVFFATKSRPKKILEVISKCTDSMARPHLTLCA